MPKGHLCLIWVELNGTIGCSMAKGSAGLIDLEGRENE